MHTAVRNLAKFDLAGEGGAFSTRGRLENFHTKKKKKRVQNGKPEIQAGDARAANAMERGQDLRPRPRYPLWPCHLSVCDGLGQVSACSQDPHMRVRDINVSLGGGEGSLS